MEEEVGSPPTASLLSRRDEIKIRLQQKKKAEEV